MTQREEGGAGEHAAPGTPASVTTTADSAALAPLRQRAFRWLWLGTFIGYIGVWGQTVGAQWLVVDAPNAATLVSLVQAAMTLPVMMLALPGGVLADSFDRRWLLFSVQVYVFIIGMLLTALTAAGLMPPALLLALTFALAIGAAVQLPTWQAMIPELVPRTQLRAATRLDMVGVNVARSIGPALAGLIIAAFGVPVVFGLYAVSVVFLALALLFWRRPAAGSEARRERFVPALRAGGRYVWHEPIVRRILLRVILFITPGMTLWALLPLVATQRLGLGSAGYGALFGALGAGAILAAFALGPVRERLSTNGLLTVAGIVFAAVLTVIVLISNFFAALATLVFAGLAWTAVISTLIAELQLFLPVWVRARGIAIYLVTFTGSMTVGALIWGLVAEGVGLQPTFLAAAVVMLGGALAGLFWRVPETGHLDREAAIYWPEPRLAIDPELDTGPVMVTVEYTVAPEREAAFLEAMDRLRVSRRRSGATRWELYRDGDRPDRFVELFSVPSWEEHMRQHEGRLTAMDQEVEEAALAFSDPPPRAEHLLPP
ncbi:MAG TPA: MFS transporter [Propionibacteriaceae bacterium]|nr:MFS transporter [Propionibacteriaceae bacterium]